MSLTSTTVSSIELVQPEIESTIQQAELSLERFQENRDSGEDLQNCIDYLNQLRGIFVVVEVQGCVLLCQESVAIANEVPVGANDDKNSLLTNLSNAIFILRRYTEYFCHKKLDHPELLLPVINELRTARKAKRFPESHFFEFDSSVSFDLSALMDVSEKARLSDFEHHAKRFRHMYQVGLLDMLRDRNAAISFRLIARAARGSAKLCAGEPLAQFWLLVETVSKAMLDNKMAVSDLRKRLFMKVEKYLRELALLGKVVSSKSGPDSLRKELLYLLAISGDDSEVVRRVLEGYRLNSLDFTEQVLAAERRRLFGPGVDVLRSLSKAMQEEMVQLKDKLDIMERGGEPQAQDIEFICIGLERLSGTLSMLDLPRISKVCDQQLTIVKSWDNENKLISENELLSVADAILTVEQAIKRFEETGIQPEIDLCASSSDNNESPFLSEAIIVVIDESQAGLSLAKRSITSFVESNGDKLHLANIAQLMEGIRGGMLMIGQKRVADLIMACLDCINVELYENEQQPDDRILETLADALASLEYYIESLQLTDTVNQQLLDLSEESLISIGYGVN